MKDFVHLHVHTEYSLLDGACRIKKLVSTIKEQGGKAVAITDHGSMAGALMFYSECYNNGIKPIIGCEFYICEDRFVKQGKGEMYHLILLAKNDVGYQNLLKLSSAAAIEGFYYKPRIDYKILEQHAEGLICLSACLGGHVPSLILERRFDEAEKIALRYKNLFMPGDFYIEIQNHNMPEQVEVLQPLVDLAKKIGVKIVATNDAHYIYKEDAEMQDVLMCVSTGKFFDDPNRIKFPTDEFYIKTREQMEEVLGAYPEALDATVEIANKCEVRIKAKSHKFISKDGGLPEGCTLQDNENFIPIFNAPDGLSNFEYLRKICYEGLQTKYKEITDVHTSRMEEELELINELGFVEYFLVVWDYINFAKQNDIPVGPGRGSGAGSIVAYTSGITNVDPLRYELLFERFIHRERVSTPDFDVDFCYDRRVEVIEYARNKYTPDNVSFIGTYGTMAAKNAIKDVARVLRVPYTDSDKITKAIPFKLPDGIKKPPVLKYYFGTTGKEENEKYILPELRKIYDEDPAIKKVVDMSIKLEGMPRQSSTHACGILITPNPVNTYVPLLRNGDEIASQYSMIELEDLGLLKMDFLGLRTLTDIDKAIKLIKRLHGVDVDFDKMDVDDPNVYKMIASGNTPMVFQIESSGFQKLMREMKPDRIEDIIAAVALYRPGPMDFIPRFIKNKHDPKNTTYDHPCLEPILKETYGVIVYQEQVMKIVQAMGGFTLGQADNVRRIMGKKKVDQMAAERKKFVEGYVDPKGIRDPIPGAVKLGINKEIAEKVFSEMEKFAQYAFNKSHAAAYAIIAYQTAYLKCYYPVEYLAAVLNNRITNLDEVKRYVIYAKEQKIEIMPPDINKSETYFSVDSGSLRFGLGALKNVGLGVVNAIIEEREKNGDYKDLYDFVKRQDGGALNKRCLESMIYSGAFDTFGQHRSQLFAVYERVVDMISKDKKSKACGQFSLFDSDSSADELTKIDFPNIKEYSDYAKLKFEKQIMGVYISGHPLDAYIDKMANFNFNSSMIRNNESEDEPEASPDEDIDDEGIVELTNDMEVTTGGIISEIRKMHTKQGNKEMALIKMEDLYGSIDLMLFPNTYERFKDSLNEDVMISVSGRLSIRKGESPVVLVSKLGIWKREEENNDEQEEPAAEKTQTLYLKYNVKDEILHQSVLKILKNYIGNTPVIIKCSESNSAFKVSYRVNANNHLLNELNALILEEYIKLI